MQCMRHGSNPAQCTSLSFLIALTNFGTSQAASRQTKHIKSTTQFLLPTKFTMSPQTAAIFTTPTSKASSFVLVHSDSTLSTASDESSSQQQSSSSSSSSSLSTTPHHRRSQNRHRQRGFTLRSGTPFHDAFFGHDDSIRETFDQEEACSQICNDRRMEQRQRRRNNTRQDSSSSSTSSSSSDSNDDSSSSSSVFFFGNGSVGSKAGRPIIPRYGEF